MAGEAAKPWARDTPHSVRPEAKESRSSQFMWCWALVLVVLLLWVLLRSGSTDDVVDTEPSGLAAAPLPTRHASPLAPAGSELPEDCMIPGQIYTASPVLTSTTAVARTFPTDVCNIDYTTGHIVCDTKIECEGGTSKSVDKVQTKRTMEYDCSKCPDIQHGSCCGKCTELQGMVAKGNLRISGQLIHEVVCHNCGTAALSSYSGSAAVTCSHNHADGTFKCSLNEHCESGMQRIETQNLSFSCLVTPCDTCDPYAKAQCCVTCLENYCNSDLDFVNRKVCRGCQIDLNRHA